MLGEILAGLTDDAVAADVARSLAPPALRARIDAAATAESVPAGALVAARVRHLLDHGDEAFWLSMLGGMSGSMQPGAAAIERVLALAFPEAERQPREGACA
jgi:hypothetical protein